MQARTRSVRPRKVAAKARPTDLPASPIVESTLEETLAYLGSASSYPDAMSGVEIVETHMSYVFLTDTTVYKLKKPVRCRFLDLTTSEARRMNCEESLRLNKRLAGEVYEAVVPITVSAGGLCLDGPGEPVDWVIKMRRLPRDLMLDRAIHEARVTRQDVVRLVRVLAAFYGSAPRTPVAPEAYRASLQQAIAQNHLALSEAAFALSTGTLDTVRNKLLRYLRRRAHVLDARVSANRIVEGHGNLRPEHVCLTPDPVFIDCLESDPQLRMVDPADELGYLAMECELLGADHIAATVLATYRACTGDAVDDTLVSFYQAQRALGRARITAAHLDDPLPDHARTKWLATAQAYLRLAERHCAALP